VDRAQAFLFDLDGTLVDSVYQHVLAWREALNHLGIDLSVWRIHRKVGMSGGLFANALLRETGREVTREQAARFYHETKPIARAFGVPDSILPPDLEAFEAYLAGQLGAGGPIRVGPTARELAEAILHPPLPGVLARAGIHPRLYDWTLWPSIGLLPTSIREDYGLPWGPLERAVSSWLVAGWRAWNPVLPPSFRQMPQALAADRRIDATDGPQ